MPWQPLLEGASRGPAWESVRAIAGRSGIAGTRAVRRPVAGRRDRRSGRSCTATWRRPGSGPESAALARRCLEHATAAVAEQPGTASLYSGLTGVGWAVAHLQGRLPGLDGEDDLAEIDEVLLDHLDQSPWRGEYDLIEGLVGFGVYALERLPRPAAVACLERVVDRLAETAEPQGEGITWWTDPAWLPAETRAEFPHGYYNLGLAHGRAGRDRPARAGLRRRGGPGQGAALARRRRTLAAGAGGPGRVRVLGRSRRAARKARLAWCYGDPGIAAALLGAARCVAEPAWESAALAIARRAAERPYAEAGIKDAGLCHGCAGLGHLFNRMFQATGEPELAQAARAWFERTLAMRRPGRGIGGYEAWQPDEAGGPSLVGRPGLAEWGRGHRAGLAGGDHADRAGLGPHAIGVDPTPAAS